MSLMLAAALRQQSKEPRRGLHFKKRSCAHQVHEKTCRTISRKDEHIPNCAVCTSQIPICVVPKAGRRQPQIIMFEALEVQQMLKTGAQHVWLAFKDASVERENIHI